VNSAGLVVAVLYVLLGLLAGRFPRLLVFVVVPVVVTWVWYYNHYGGPNDHITGVAAIIGAGLGVVLFLAAAALSWQARRAWKRTHSN
jgi:hypothetical protein